MITSFGTGSGLRAMLLAGMAALAIASCSTADGPALPGPVDGGNTAGSTDMGCVGIPAGDCTTCLQANCNTELTTCFTGTWPSTGSGNGICRGLFDCTCACEAKGNMGCGTTCATSIGAACAACVTGVDACRTKFCAGRCP